MRGFFSVFLSAVLVASHTAGAQQAQVRSADAVLAPPAELYRVDDGVFALRPGMSVDLTDRKILLTVRQSWAVSQRDRERFFILLNGETERARAGTRFNLKKNRATREVVKDKAQCFLDVVSFVAPTGAPPTATFRVSCV